MTRDQTAPDPRVEAREDGAELLRRAVGEDLSQDFGLERLMDLLRAAPQERTTR